MSQDRATDESLPKLLWRIENISFWEKEFHGESIPSSIFKSINVPGNAWNLRLFPKGSHYDPNIAAELESLEDIQIFPANCSWSLLDGNGLSVESNNLQGKVLSQGFFQQSTLYRKLQLYGFPSYEDIFVTRKTSLLPNDVLTLQLRFWRSDGTIPHSEHISIVTRVEVAEESFTWHIKQITSLQLGQQVIAPFYLDFSRIRGNYKLKLSLTGKSLNEAKFNIEIVADNANDQSLKATISILDNKQEATISAAEEHIFRSSVHEQSWILKTLSYSKTLERAPDFLNGDDMILHCKFTAVLKDYYNCIEQYKFKSKTNIASDNSGVLTKNSNKICEEAIPKTIVSTILKGSIQTSLQHVPQRKRGSMTVLGKDLLSLYQDNILSDFELRSGEVSFPVHKNVLYARSPVFKAMFSSDMTESGSASMDVQDLDVHTLGRMLTFLYAETIDDDLEYESAEKLYYAADKYQVPSLKEECLPVLRSNITVSNVCDVLELADRHQDQILTSWVHSYIQDHFDEVINTVEWDKFLRRSPLGGITMKEVYSKMASLKSK